MPHFLFSKTQWCGNGALGKALGRVWWEEPTLGHTQLWDLNPVAPEQLWSLVAVVTAMAAQPGAWNGEFGHSCTLWGDSHWGLRLGVGAWMGGGSPARGRWLESTWHREANFGLAWDRPGLGTFGLHSRLDGLPWVGRRLRNVILPCRAACCLSAKAVVPYPLPDWFPNQPYPILPFPTLANHKYQAHGSGLAQGLRVDSGAEERNVFLWEPGRELVLTRPTFPFPVALLFLSYNCLPQPHGFKTLRDTSFLMHCAKPNHFLPGHISWGLHKSGLGQRKRTRNTEQLHSKLKSHMHTEVSPQLSPLQPCPPAGQRVEALLIKTLPWMSVAQLLVQNLAHTWELLGRAFLEGCMVG